MDAAINIAKQATTLEEAGAAYEILETAKVFLNRADALAELERSRLMNLNLAAQSKQRSYAQIASRGVPPVMKTTSSGRMTATQIEAKSQDPEERRKMAVPPYRGGKGSDREEYAEGGRGAQGGTSEGERRGNGICIHRRGHQDEVR